MSLDLTKPMSLRNGSEVRFLGRIKSERPLVFAAKVGSTDLEVIGVHHENGRYSSYGESSIDVVNVVRRRVSYRIVGLLGTSGQPYPTLEEAKKTWNPVVKKSGFLTTYFEDEKVVDVKFTKWEDEDVA